MSTPIKPGLPDLQARAADAARGAQRLADAGTVPQETLNQIINGKVSEELVRKLGLALSKTLAKAKQKRLASSGRPNGAKITDMTEEELARAEAFEAAEALLDAVSELFAAETGTTKEEIAGHLRELAGE